MAYNKEYYQANKERFSAAQKKWQQKTGYVTVRTHHLKNRNKRMWHAAKQRAEKQRIEFYITVEDIVIPKICPILNIPITNELGKGRMISTASLDRIDPLKGYTVDNIQVISDLANRMKANATPAQLIAFAKGILRIYSPTSLVD